MANQRIPSSGQRNNGKTHFCTSPVLISEVVNKPFALSGHVTSFLCNENYNYDFAFEKRLEGHILNKIIVIWFFKPAPFS